MTATGQVVLPVAADLREAWREESDFGRWLRHPKHLKLIGDLLGFELEYAELEFPVGSSFADMRCNVAGESTCAIIELQLERTDDPHLGQLLGNWGLSDAAVVIWISRKCLARHIAAFDKLNRKNTGSKFFAVEVSVYRAPQTDYLFPTFNVVVKPNSSPRRLSAPGSRHVKAKSMGALRLRYWTALSHAFAQVTDVRFQRPRPFHRLRSCIGRKGHWVDAVIHTPTSRTTRPTIAVQLTIKTEHAAASLGELKALDKQLSSRIGEPLHWHVSPRLKAAKVYVTLDADFTDESTWQMQFAWLARFVVLFHSTFGPLVRRSKVAPAAKPIGRTPGTTELIAAAAEHIMQGVV